MAHKVMIDGTLYDIQGGKTMVDGTVYDIQGGRTMVDGTARDIEFKTTHRITVKSISQKDDGGYRLDTKYGRYYSAYADDQLLAASIEGVTTNVRTNGTVVLKVNIGDLSISGYYNNSKSAIYLNGRYVRGYNGQPYVLQTQAKEITVAFERSEYTDYEGTQAYGSIARITTN